jgi:hypothetical protein
MLFKIKNRQFNLDEKNICVTVFDNISIDLYEQNVISSNDKKNFSWDFRVIPLEALLLKIKERNIFDISFKKQNKFFFVLFGGDAFWIMSDHLEPI